MRSIYEQALGTDFDCLHPQIQKRFGFNSKDGIASIGEGVMEEIWHGRFYTLPFLYLGSWRRIMFPEQGRNIAFRVENYAYRDEYGRETVTWVRTYHTQRTRRFDAYMIFSARRQGIVDYMGTHQHLAVDLKVWTDERGGLRLRSSEQRFYEGMLAFKFPMLFSGVADVCEWYDDETQKYRIDVDVHNPLWGPLFGYRGWFDVTWREVKQDVVPAHLRPIRVECRE
jgi:Domain of unknown function (DUF4166)